MTGSRDAGFTLLEVMVAFAIAALALAALLQGAGVGLGGTRIAAQYQRALSVAQSRLAAGDAFPPTPGEQSGTEPGGFGWRTVTTPLQQAPPTAENPARLTLYATSVTVTWAAGGTPRHLSLSTQRLAAAPPPPP